MARRLQRWRDGEGIRAAVGHRLVGVCRGGHDARHRARTGHRAVQIDELRPGTRHNDGLTTTAGAAGLFSARWGLVRLAVVDVGAGQRAATTVTSNTTVTELLRRHVDGGDVDDAISVRARGAAVNAGVAPAGTSRSRRSPVVGHRRSAKRCAPGPRALGERDGVAQRVARRGFTAVHVDDGLGGCRQVRIERRGVTSVAVLAVTTS